MGRATEQTAISLDTAMLWSEESKMIASMGCYPERMALSLNARLAQGACPSQADGGAADRYRRRGHGAPAHALAYTATFWKRVVGTAIPRLLTVGVSCSKSFPGAAARIVNDLVRTATSGSSPSLAASTPYRPLAGRHQAGPERLSQLGWRARDRNLRRGACPGELRFRGLIDAGSRGPGLDDRRGVGSIGGFVGGRFEPYCKAASVLGARLYDHVGCGWRARLSFSSSQLVFVPLMQGAMNRRTRARVQIIRQLSVSVVKAAATRSGTGPTTSTFSSVRAQHGHLSPQVLWAF